MQQSIVFKTLTALGLILILTPKIVFADTPSITIIKGNPEIGTPAPYTFEFAVSNQTGISSIKVNGRELYPTGNTYYEAEWSTNLNGTFTITAADSEGNSTSYTLVISNLGTAVPTIPTEAPTTAPTQAPTPAATVAPTQAPTPAATVAPTPAPTRATAPPTTEATTEAEKTTEETMIEIIEEIEERNIPRVTDISFVGEYSIKYKEAYLDTVKIDKPKISDITSFASNAIKISSANEEVARPIITNIVTLGEASITAYRTAREVREAASSTTEASTEASTQPEHTDVNTEPYSEASVQTSLDETIGQVSEESVVEESSPVEENSDESVVESSPVEENSDESVVESSPVEESIPEPIIESTQNTTESTMQEETTTEQTTTEGSTEERTRETKRVVAAGSVSYKLKKSNTLRYIIATICSAVTLQMLLVIVLNIRRLSLYKKFLKAIGYKKDDRRKERKERNKTSRSKRERNKKKAKVSDKGKR